MGWQLGNNQSEDTSRQDDAFIKFPQLKKPYDTHDIKMRVVSGDQDHPDQPVDCFQHWVDNRPYVCPGFRQCPVCSERMKAKNSLPDHEFKNHRLFRMNRRYFFNVLSYETGEPEMKVFAFGPSVAKKLYSLASRLGDLRGYDITVRQTKNGPLMQNVEYDAWNEKDRELTDIDKEKSLEVFELAQFIEPAPMDTLMQVVHESVPATTNTNIKSKLDRLEKLAKDKGGLTLDHLGVNETTPESRIDELLEHLSD